MKSGLALFCGLVGLAAPLAAQDTTRAPEGVRIGIDYRPGERPSIVVLPSPGRDSIRAILLRDLDYSDRFEVIPLGSGAASTTVNYVLLRSLGADFGVEIGRNLIHASDGADTAAYEIPLYFTEAELVAWDRAVDRWINE